MPPAWRPSPALPTPSRVVENGLLFSHATMEVKADPTARSRTLGTMALIAVVSTAGVLTWLMSRPLPALPTEMPVLAFDAGEVADQLRTDRRHAESLPSSERSGAHQTAIHEANLGELDPGDRPASARARHERLVATLAAAMETHGDDVRLALRAADLQRAMHALRETGSERDRELGGLVPTLERYGMVENGRQVAPDFVVRTIFKARWNGRHDRPLTEDLSDAELRAYWGWLALEADSAPVARRLEAVTEFGRAGGAHEEEARGVLLMQAGRRDEAAEAFEAAWARTPRFRVRNHALAARAEL